jgi:hypothetical protein
MWPLVHSRSHHNWRIQEGLSPVVRRTVKSAAARRRTRGRWMYIVRTRNAFHSNLYIMPFVQLVASLLYNTQLCPPLLQRRFEVLTLVVMKGSIFWDTTPCSPLKINWRFGEIYLLHIDFERIRQARNQHKSGSKHTTCFVLVSLLGLFFNSELACNMFLWNVPWLYTGFIVIFQKLQLIFASYFLILSRAFWPYSPSLIRLVFLHAVA